MDRSPTYVGRPKFRRRCGDGEQRRYTAAMQACAMAMAGSGAALQRCKLALLQLALLQLASQQRGDDVATCIARALRHCFCSFRHGSVVMLLLQHLSRENSDVVAANVVATLLQLALLR